MKTKYDFEGFDELEKTINQLEQNVENLSKETVDFSELFNKSFFRSNSISCKSFEEFLSCGGFNVSSQEDFDSIPSNELDNHVRNISKFNTFQEMLEEASSIYISAKLFDL